MTVSAITISPSTTTPTIATRFSRDDACERTVLTSSNWCIRIRSATIARSVTDPNLSPVPILTIKAGPRSQTT